MHTRYLSWKLSLLPCSDSIPLDWEREYGGAAGNRIGSSDGSGMWPITCLVGGLAEPSPSVIVGV